MRIDGPGRTHKRLSLTPLVDVIFLLLMFFMLSSSYLKYADIDLGERARQATDAPQDGSAAEPAFAPGLTVLIRVGADGVVEVNGEAVDRLNLIDRLDRFAAAGAESALLMASGGASVQDLISALETARRSRIPTILINR